MKYVTVIVACGLLAAIPQAQAQQTDKAMSAMDMSKPGTPKMGSTKMMTQCAHMHEQMQHGKMAPGMEKMMVQCEAMDRDMNKGATSAPAATHSR